MSGTAETFAFKPGDLVLVKWNDSMVYFAKIKRIDQRRKKCVVVFDDKSQDEADFDQIHSVDETTTDIICIKCKRDDSDSPNEIVLCDKCGIGYHQKCHTPPIPASALELDTPWNCTYCLRGVKCPYLTESLDVLQNLLSDEESHSHDDVESVTTIESDEGGEEFTSPAVQQYGKFLAPPRPQKKRGRKPKIKRGPKPKDPAKPHADVVLCTRDGSGGHTGSLLAGAETAPSPTATKDDSYSHLKRKRSQFSAVAVPKRPRKPSVQSQTLSVTRIPGPVHGGSISPKSEDNEDEKRHSPSKSATETGRNLFTFHIPIKSSPAKARRFKTSESMETSPQPLEPVPRSLRVSLNLPEETEPGSPLEKIMRSQKILSPKFTVSSLPLWEDAVKSSPLSSTEKSFAPGGQSRNISQQQQSPAGSRSSTPKNEGPLTPFTASALPLQAGVKTSESEPRKRKSGERDDVGGATVPPKKTKLSTPESPSDDVFTVPKESVAGNTATKAHTVAAQSDPLRSAVTPQVPEPVSSQAIDNVQSVVSLQAGILVGTATAPVGYGAESLPKVGKSLIQEAPTPKEQPYTVDKGRVGGSTFPTAESPAPIVEDLRQVSATITTPGGDMGGKQPVPSPPIILPTTEHLPGKVQNPGVIKSPLEPSDSTAGCSVGYSGPSVSPTPGASSSDEHTAATQPHIQSPTLGKSPAQTPAATSPSAATAVSVITSHSSSATGPTSTSVGTSHAKLKHTSKMADSDIIITGVEVSTKNKPPHSLPLHKEVVHSKAPGTVATSKATTSTVSGASYTPTIKGRTQNSNEKQMAPVTKVTAKIAEIKPGPVTSSQVRSGPQQRSTQLKQTSPAATSVVQSRRGAGSVVKSVSTQSSVAVVPLVATPTAYTQTLPHPDSTAYTIVPAEAVVHGRPGVALAVPPERAVKPCTLTLNDATAVIVPQTPQNATPVQYIIEPMVPATSTSVVYNHNASIPATAVTPSQAMRGTSENGSVYTHVIGNKALPVTTTKPYAIVPAQPTASVELQGIAIDQRGTPIISPQLPLGYSAVPAASYIHAVATPTSDKSSTPDNWARSSKSSKLDSMHNQVSSHPQRVPDEQAPSQLDEIGKNISDAFANSSEKLLIAAFEDAWKKFQANGKKYQSTTSGVRKMGQSEAAVHTKPIAPPNAEVVSVPGTSSRLSLIRPTYSKSKISAVRSNPDQVVRVTDSQRPAPESQQKQQQNVQYVYYPDGSVVNTGTTIYAITPSNAEVTAYNQVIKHPHPQGKPGVKTYQVQSAGVFVPARATDLGSGKQATLVVDAGSAKTVVKPPRNQQTTERNISVVQHKQATERSVQHLRKQQAGVANGEYAVMKQKSVPAAGGKSVRQCALCTKEATYLCSGCRKIWYCGRNCQLEAWNEHSMICSS